MSTRDLPAATVNDWWNPFLWIMLAPIVTVPLSALLFVLLVGTHNGSDVGLPDTSLPFQCFIDCPAYAAYEYSEVAPTVAVFALPGLLNLGPFVWVFSKKPKVRFAGIVAGLLGLLRLSVPPMALMLSFTRFTGADGTSYFQYSYDPDPYFDMEPLSEPLLDLLSVVWGIGFLAWLASVLAFAVALCFMDRDRCVPEKQTRARAPR